MTHLIPGTAVDQSIARYVARAAKAPRIAGLSAAFDDLAVGVVGQPQKRVSLDPSLLGWDAEALAFWSVHHQRAGHFNNHFTASIPFVLEEQCRMGAALWRFAVRLEKEIGRPVRLYTLGDAAGVTARALTQLGNGSIRTLTCSPTQANQRQFYECGAPNGAHFFLGPFFDVTPATLRRAGISGFDGGFDVLIEDTTFQMYGPERYEPIALARRNLAEDGIFILIEKLRCPDIDDYLRREHQKDHEFKTRFFDPLQIQEKRATILTRMQDMEVSLEALADALQRHFSTAVATWNSGNFYTIAASNNSNRLTTFVEGMLPPAIPPAYCYEQLPRILFPTDGWRVEFRRSSSDSQS